MSAKEIKVLVSGGDVVENDLVATSIHHHLSHGGFEKVALLHDFEEPKIEPEPGISLYDMVDRLRPDLFETPINIKAETQSFPDQRVVLDEHGRERYKENTVVRYLLDEGPFDMNHLARIPFPLEDRQQFAQLIGYSVDGYETLSYSPGAMAAAAYEEAREQTERVALHGAAPVSYTAAAARDYEMVDDKTFAVEIEQSGTSN